MNRKSRASIDIGLLQTFHLVATLGSFSAAARSLGTSYQSAANHVRRLEQIYGAPLVSTERGSRRVELTPQGRAVQSGLASELESILSRLSLLVQDAQAVLRVGVPQALFHQFFPEILTRFRATGASVELAFYERDTTLEKMMHDGALDAAVSERSFGLESVTQARLGRYHLSLIYPRSWRLRVSGPGALPVFADRPLINYEPSQSIRVRAVDYLRRHFGHPPVASISVSGSTSLTRLVESGLGYAIVPEWMVKRGHPRVHRLILTDLDPMDVYFSHCTLLDSNPAVKQLRDLCASVMGASFSFSDYPGEL